MRKDKGWVSGLEPDQAQKVTDRKIMNLFYLIHQAIGSLKFQIEQHEARLAAAKNPYEKKSLKRIIQWLFERGMNMLRLAEDNEIDQDLVDWYLNRVKGDRPDIARFKRKLKAKMKERGRVRELPSVCPICGESIIAIPAGVSRRTNRPYDGFWACQDRDCEFTCNKIRTGYECKYPKHKKIR